ncbi:hypothetical protein GLIP_3941 [Aliiglaciecola lipolytica E3]|uniref:Uncharacterized protein n=1 Tax=Aliiglaciecola lipolytica E3 TaxID=1127673 RepID=K6YEF4_9ALTE|nr:hypothetical protein GLIP_3941 [Aliiglaciecola lipolytica E3]
MDFAIGNVNGSDSTHYVLHVDIVRTIKKARIDNKAHNFLILGFPFYMYIYTVLFLINAKPVFIKAL